MPGLLADDYAHDDGHRVDQWTAMAEGVASAETRALQREYKWLLDTHIVHTLERVAALTKDCCRKLPLPSKLGNFGQSYPNLGLQPEKFTLVGAGATDAIKAVLTLMGDNVVQAEVAVRYARAPGHMFRAIAQPSVQWKLQQIQDAANYILATNTSATAALTHLTSAGGDANASSDDSQMSRQTWIACRHRGQTAGRALDDVIEQITMARNALLLPKKRSLVELREHASNTCFTPVLPPDLTLSFYVAGDRLTCAAYHIQSTTTTVGNANAGAHATRDTLDGASRQTFVVVQSECQVQWLTDVTAQLSAALQYAQQMKDKLAMFDDIVNDAI